MRRLEESITAGLNSISDMITTERRDYQKIQATSLDNHQAQLDDTNQQISVAEKQLDSAHDRYEQKKQSLIDAQKNRQARLISGLEQRYRELQTQQQPKIDAVQKAISNTKHQLAAITLVIKNNQKRLPELIPAMMEQSRLNSQLQKQNDNFVALNKPLHDILDKRKTLQKPISGEFRFQKNEDEIASIEDNLAALKNQQAKLEQSLQRIDSITEQRLAAFDSAREQVYQLTDEWETTCKSYRTRTEKHKDYHMLTGDNTWGVITRTSFKADDELATISVPTEDKVRKIVTRIYDASVRLITDTIVYNNEFNHSVKMIQDQIDKTTNALQSIADSSGQKGAIPRVHHKETKARMKSVYRQIKETKVGVETSLKKEFYNSVTDELNGAVIPKRAKAKQYQHGTREENITRLVESKMDEFSKTRKRSQAFTDPKSEQEGTQGRTRSGATRSHTPPNVGGGKG